jgi:DNA polymerase III alpha subunit/nucleotidyltransferase/DNA polymerase involved in DNA repair
MSRAIVHLDADAFFAAVEQAADPRLRGKAVAVGGEKRGIIASASYEARKFGVYTPMPTVRARKLCPKLIVLPGDFERYEQFSNWMFGYCYDFTPEVEQTSIDEGYFDLSAARKPPAEIALTIRRAIRQKLKITVSEGIGTNKLVSAVASKLTKPAAFSEVPPGREAVYLQPLPNQWLPGIGPKTSGRLNAAGLARIGHVAATPLEMLALLLGSQAAIVRQFAHGIDERPLIPVRAPQKSFSRQETFVADLTDEDYLEAALRRMADELFARVREEGRSIRTLTVKVRYNDMAEEQVNESLVEPTDLETDVYGRLHIMLRQAWKRRVSLRLVSLKLSNVYDGRFRGELPLEASAQHRDARLRLAVAVDELRKSRGRSVVMRGHDFTLREAPVEFGETSRKTTESHGFTQRGKAATKRVNHERTWIHPDSKGLEAELKTANGALTPALSHPMGEGAWRAGEGLSARRFSTPVRTTEIAEAPRSRSPAGPSRLSNAGLAAPARKSPIVNRKWTAGYLPLRVHSHYSFLDSTLAPAAIVELARRHGLPAVALADTGNLHGAVEFVEAAKAAGVKPVLGVELRVDNQPLLLYVESARGYHHLCRLLSEKAEAEGKMQNAESEPAPTRAKPSAFSLQPSAFPASVAAAQRASVNSSFVIRHSSLLEGLIAVGDDTRLAELFPGRFYRRVAAREMPADFPAAACPAIHYAAPGDRQRYDILQSIRTLTLLRQGHPEKQSGGRFHFRASAEMAAVCREHPDWLRHTLEIAERCQFELPFGKPQFPAFAPPDGSAPGDFLRRLVLDGARRRYPEAQISSLRSQIEQELAIINGVGYEEYFLITWDFLGDCRRRGIGWITRGSAADSLVCYCLGISSVCPVRFDLYFRRFLNRERMALHKLPDIDIDFAHDVKDDVVRLLFEKYGRDHCAVVGGFSTFQARSAFAEVAKVLGVAEREVRKFTEHFPWGFGGGWVPDEPAPHGGAGLIELLRANPETRDLPLDEEPYRTALQTAEFLDGMPRYPKMHPCGLVLSRQPLHELTPTFIANKGYATTHFDMDAVEAIGLVKMDILAQGGLAVMRDVKQSLAAKGIHVELPGENDLYHEPHGGRAGSPLPAANVARQSQGQQPRERSSSGHAGRCAVGNNLSTSVGSRGAQGTARPTQRPYRSAVLLPDATNAALPPEPWQDPEVWEMIAGGGARAVHHIESPAMTSLCRMSNVREIDGLIAIVSVIRPGAANEGKKLAFTRRYQGLEPVTYPHPSLASCLRSTYGLVVYEEHILQICEAFAGLPPGRADVLRRALNKQKRAVIEEIRGEFFASARARGHAPEKIAEVWGLVTGFAGYAFCKAHSTAYGVEAYQSAWLKRYFPAEFMAAVLSNGKGFYHPLVYALECHRLGLKLRPPSVNEPGPAFKAEEGRKNAEVDSAALPKAVSAFRLPPSAFIRVPLTRVKGLTARTTDAMLEARARGPFGSMTDFFRRVMPSGEELEAMIRAGGFDEFGATRTQQFWEAQRLLKSEVRNPKSEGSGRNLEFNFTAAADPSAFSLQPSAFLQEPSRLERLRWETELFGFAVSGHPLELFPDVAWDTYCPVNRLGEFVGQTVATCGLVVEQRTHHQITGEPMKFLTLADWTGMVETELFAPTYRSHGLATVRYPVLEVEARVEPFENGRGFSLRALRAGKPRTRPPA